MGKIFEQALLKNDIQIATKHEKVLNLISNQGNLNHDKKPSHSVEEPKFKILKMLRIVKDVEQWNLSHKPWHVLISSCNEY